ncbi:hypothetical protein E1264_11840 [Actinomadura sp. KC216]|uniref:hypothetical protein n=1 Tax=Actinomadura sp. KC216 TaxID=2530370 RepID=UPI0010444067|nr:hypothetical protein [Actinomadura sp. KC216]TDB88366.1 hypothetical protein E1264_11840 [Actinomadura sp. KC216]
MLHGLGLLRQSGSFQECLMRGRVAAETWTDGLAGLSSGGVDGLVGIQLLAEILRPVLGEGLEPQRLGGVGDELGHVGSIQWEGHAVILCQVARGQYLKSGIGAPFVHAALGNGRG